MDETNGGRGPIKGSIGDLYKPIPRRPDQLPGMIDQATPPLTEQPAKPRLRIIEVPPHILPPDASMGIRREPTIVQPTNQSEDQLPLRVRLKRAAEDSSVTLGRRELVTGAAILGLGTAGIIERGRVEAFVQRRLLGRNIHETKTAAQPEPEFVPIDQLVLEQDAADLSAIAEQEYLWKDVNSDHEEVDVNKPKIVKMQMAPLNLDYNTVGFMVHRGSGPDVKIETISAKTMGEMFPGLEADVVRVQGPKQYIVEETGQDTNILYGFVGGIRDGNNINGVFLDITSGKKVPVKDGQQPSFMIGDFGSIVPVASEE